MKGSRPRVQFLWCAITFALMATCCTSDKIQRQSPFSFGVDSSFNPKDLNYLVTLGNPNGGARITFYWKMIEPLPGVWDFTFYDDLVARAKGMNVPLIGILAYSVKWASPADPGPGDASSFSYYPPRIGDFITYVKTLVSRYPSVHSWEIWNEPNGPRFWLPQPDIAQYSQLLEASYRTIKDLNSQDVVILGGLAPGRGSASNSIRAEDFLAGIYQNGAGADFDSVGFHPYNPGVDPDLYLDNYVTSLHNVMAENGGGDRKILITELGWYSGTASGAVTEATQADFLSRAFFILYRLEFVGGYYWYHLKDHTDFPQPAVPDLNYGLFRWDGSPRPAASTFQALTQY